jgi:hypothetical protein
LGVIEDEHHREVGDRVEFFMDIEITPPSDDESQQITPSSMDRGSNPREVVSQKLQQKQFSIETMKPINTPHQLTFFQIQILTNLLIPLKFRLPDPQLSLSAEMSISPS